MQPDNPYQNPNQNPAPNQNPYPTQNPVPNPAPTPVSNPTPNPTPAPDSNPIPDVNNPLAAMQPGEQVVCDIKRHPIGLIGNYVVAGIILLIFATIAIVAPTYASDTMKHQAEIWALGGFVFFAAFMALALVIMTTVYKGNRWIVTDDSITEITQVSLFSKRASQLSLHNLEDVTVSQNGIIQTAFNFGTIKAETAGERPQFSFTYCPNPNEVARKILVAREKFMGEGSFQGRPGYGQNQGSDTNINTGN